MKKVEVGGLIAARWGDGKWALLGRKNGRVLLVRVVDSGLIASRRYQVSVDSASLAIRGVIFAT
jgi:hypothetical protein